MKIANPMRPSKVSITPNHMSGFEPRGPSPVIIARWNFKVDRGKRPANSETLGSCTLYRFDEHELSSDEYHATIL